MIDKTVELMTYATKLGDARLMGLIAQSMGEIEVSDNPAKTAKASRIAALGGMAITPSVMVMNCMQDIAKEGRVILNEVKGDES
jgi:hypothetical protein